MNETTPSYDAIIPDRLYVGNLPAALDSALLERLEISHVLSVCHTVPTTSCKHMNIALEDSEYSDILIQLPHAVSFIESALSGADDEGKAGGRVFVHCRMGISRSATVVCAYLMKTRGLSSHDALRFVQQARPCIHPNYGFIKQLAVYEACSFEPNLQHPLYRSWKRRQRQDVLGFLNLVQDTTQVIPGSVFLSSELPNDPIGIECLLVELGITHVLSLAPSSPLTSSTDTPLPESITYFHIPLPKPQSSQLVTTSSPLIRALPTACKLVGSAIEDKNGDDDGGDGVERRILIYSEIESRACAVFCAYLIQARGISANDALTELRAVLPLFDPTTSFVKTLQLFDSLLASEMHSRTSSRTTSFSSEAIPGSSIRPLSSLSSPPPSPPSSISSVESDCPSPPLPLSRHSKAKFIHRAAVADSGDHGGRESHDTDDSDGEEDVARLTKRAARILGGTKMSVHVDAFSEALMKLGVRDAKKLRRLVEK